MKRKVITLIVTATSVTVMHGNANLDVTHHCHEDEYQYVTPQGLTCSPIDGGESRVVAEQYEFARL